MLVLRAVLANKKQLRLIAEYTMCISFSVINFNRFYQMQVAFIKIWYHTHTTHHTPHTHSHSLSLLSAAQYLATFSCVKRPEVTIRRSLSYDGSILSLYILTAHVWPL